MQFKMHFSTTMLYWIKLFYNKIYMSSKITSIKFNNSEKIYVYMTLEIISAFKND